MLDVVDGLLAAGMRNSECDSHGSTPLHYAVHHKHPKVARRLLDAKAAAEVGNLGGVSPWELALRVGSPLVRRAFSPSASDVDHPADAEHPAGHWRVELTPLQLAADHADAAKVAALLEEPVHRWDPTCQTADLVPTADRRLRRLSAECRLPNADCRLSAVCPTADCRLPIAGLVGC